MSFHRWLQNLRSTLTPGRGQRPSRRRSPRQAVTHRPNLEVLEDRLTPSFSTPVNYAVAAHAVVSGDFNNDTVLDLAVANGGGVSVLLGNGDGTFHQAPDSPTGVYLDSLAVGDLNGDGNLDLASANGGEVDVLLGNGDGTFQTPIGFFFGWSPASVAVGDFNGDGKLDLGAVTNATIFQGFDYDGNPVYGSEGYANVLIGNGDGTFSGPTVSDLGPGYHSAVAAANFNGDACSDLAIINEDYGTVSVALGNGGGYLDVTGEYYTGGYYPIFVTAGDVNGDHLTDLAVANYDGNVGVLLGNGNGTLQPVNNYVIGNNPTAVVIGDFTGDGHADLAATNNSQNQIGVLQARGDGTFFPAATYPAGSFPYGLAAGDFNGDGWLDAATANTGNNGTTSDVSVLINDRAWPAADAPSISINDVTVTEGNTGTTSATFTLTLSAVYSHDVTVHYQTADISATAGSDYTAASGVVTIPAGQLNSTVTIAVLGDRLAEPTETFAVNLGAPTNAFIADNQGIGSIVDDEPRITINDVTVIEGNTGSINATFTVTLSRVYDAPVTVHFDTADSTATAGSDYTAASGDVTFAPGQTSRPITIAVLGDRLVESTERFAVNLSSPTNAGITDSQGIGTILDNEPRISINNVSKKEGNGNGTTAFVFTVTLSAAYDLPVTFSYATANGTATAGSDYVAQSGTLTFAPGQTSKTITILVNRDRDAEPDETFFVNLSGASSYASFADWQGIGTILNDDR
jgi:hypothetical protein